MFELKPSPIEVRALLGVDDLELTDEKVGLSVYMTQLEGKLDDVHSELTEIYAELDERHKDQNTDGGHVPSLEPLNRNERKLYGTVQVLATYELALLIAPALPMFALKKETDGKAEGERFNTAAQDTLDALEVQAGDLVNRTNDLLEELGYTVEVQTFLPFGVATLAVDPVTGE